MYRCNNRSCRQKSPIREGTFFNISSLSFDKILSVLVGWILRYPKNFLQNETGLSENTVSKLISEFRDLIKVWLLESDTKIGGEGHIVEIDESAFGKRKYNRGRFRRTRWVVGGIDRETKKCFLTVVPSRDVNTLTSVIVENVLPGTRIMTDCRKNCRKNLLFWQSF